MQARAIYELISRNYVWPNMWKEIQTHVQACGVCQRVNVAPRPPPTIVHRLPWEELTVDFVGHFPDGSYVFTAVDRASRFLISKKMDSSALTPAWDFLQTVLVVMPKPKLIHVDQVSEDGSSD